MENDNYWSETQDREPPRGRARDSQPAIPRRSAATGSSGGSARGASAASTWPRTTTSTASVAIKVPNPERVAGPGDVEAYLAEARALARLDHPNIVPVYDVGRTDDGLCYVVSKYIDGSDLAERMQAGPAVVPRIGRAGGDGRRGAAPRPHAGPGPPRHQAGQHPARRRGRALRGRLRAGAARTRTTARGPGWPGRPPT